MVRSVPAPFRWILLLFAWAQIAHAQSGAELTRLVDCPTAGILQKGNFALDLRLFGEGGVAGQLSAGALKRLTISVAYGGERILGSRPVEWYPRLEAGARYRLAEESAGWPAIVLGYETQGYGTHAHGRYETKARGMFVAVSKNYLSSLGQFGLHAGLNRSSDDGDGDDDLTGWIGMDKSINEQLTVVGEWDLGRNQDEGRGWDALLANVGLRFAVSRQLTIALVLKDLFRSNHTEQFTRELTIRYTEEF